MPRGLQRRHSPKHTPVASVTRVANVRYVHVDANRLQRGEIGRYDSSERPDAPQSNQDANAAAEPGQQQAFGQELLDHAAAPGAERESYRHFAAAPGGPRQQQVGDVGAGDDQHEADGREQHEEREPKVPVGLVQWLQRQ